MPIESIKDEENLPCPQCPIVEKQQWESELSRQGVKPQIPNKYLDA